MGTGRPTPLIICLTSISKGREEGTEKGKEGEGRGRIGKITRK